MYVYRWKDTNPHTVTYNQWYEWEVCRDEHHVNEIREYIKAGYAYQIAKVSYTDIEGFEARVESDIKDIPITISTDR